MMLFPTASFVYWPTTPDFGFRMAGPGPGCRVGTVPRHYFVLFSINEAGEMFHLLAFTRPMLPFAQSKSPDTSRTR